MYPGFVCVANTELFFSFQCWTSRKGVHVFSSWQLEEKTEKSLGELDSSAEGKGALKKEREVHQKLLADSHGLVMDLRWQIHHREKNWNREKVELLERLDSERQEWGRQKEELLWRVEQVGMLQPQNAPQVQTSA